MYIHKKPFLWFFLFALFCLPLFAKDGDKAKLISSIEEHSDAYWNMAKQIWEWAEPGYQEEKSSALLASYLENAGFLVEMGVAEIPTAFTATYGSSKPVIGILGEFDALPGLAQEVAPGRIPRAGSNGYGHACGHHLFAVASCGAAIAIAEQMQAGRLPGTIRFYGTPAEEGGSAKVFMARAGLFDDCDAVLHWHPGDENSAGDPTSLARIAVKFRFHGRSAHAAGAPDQARSALDAVELTNHAAELLREHTPDFTRIHHVVTAGGGAPNVVPDFAEVFYYVRHPNATVVRTLYQRLLKCAQAGALATETKLQVEYLGGIYNILPNDALAKITLRNLRELADIQYTEEERRFAEELQLTLSNPKPIETVVRVSDLSGQLIKGSTDVGDISWVVPTTGFRTATWVPGVPAHSWQAVACGGSSIGLKGMMLAAETLAATAWDLYQKPTTLKAAKAELEKRRAGRKYQAMLEPGQKPPLDYRNPPNISGK